MSIEITHVHTEPVHQNTHEVITHYAWREIETGKTGSFNKPSAVAWVRQGGRAFVGAGVQQVPVFIRERLGVEPYLQTYADGVWSNNLLNLPRY